MKLFNNNWLRADTAENEETHTEETAAVTPGDWFTSKEHYLEFKAAFKAYASDKNKRHGLTSGHFLLYAILRNRDWKKGWTYPENPGKRVEHTYKIASAFNKITSVYNEEHLLKPFDGTITTEMLMAIREHLDEIKGDK